MIARELEYGITMLGNLIPLLQEYVDPVFKVTNDLQSNIGDINIKADEYAKYDIHKSLFVLMLKQKNSTLRMIAAIL